MLTKIDSQLDEYDSRVGNSLQMISAVQGKISVQDLQKALAVIKHKPDDDVGQAVIQKLDVDKDGFVELEHVLGLVREEGLGALFRFFQGVGAADRLAQASWWTRGLNLSSGKAPSLKTTPSRAKKTSCRNDNGQGRLVYRRSRRRSFSVIIMSSSPYRNTKLFRVVPHSSATLTISCA
jgi:hypothetical protein